MFQHVSHSSGRIHSTATTVTAATAATTVTAATAATAATATPTTLSPADTALARHHSHLLLSRLYLEGLTPALLPYVEAVPEWAATIGQPFDAEEAADDHYRLLTHALFPYEAFFLDSTGLLGGEINRQIEEIYEQRGYRVGSSSDAADHIGHELGFLAFLCAAESGSWRNRETAVAIQFRSLQQSFLEEHLLRWMTPLTVALRFQCHVFYTELARLTLALLHDHYADLSSTGNGGDGAPSAFMLPDNPQRLSDRAASLRDVVRHLLTPPFSGFFLGRDAIVIVGRQLNLPIGFGNREDLLATLLRTGGQYEVAPDCLDALYHVTLAWQREYGTTVAEFPAFAPFIVPWQTRAGQTAALLAQLAAQL